MFGINNNNNSTLANTATAVGLVAVGSALYDIGKDGVKYLGCKLYNTIYKDKIAKEKEEADKKAKEEADKKAKEESDKLQASVVAGVLAAFEAKAKAEAEAKAKAEEQKKTV